MQDKIKDIETLLRYNEELNKRYEQAQEIVDSTGFYVKGNLPCEVMLLFFMVFLVIMAVVGIHFGITHPGAIPLVRFFILGIIAFILYYGYLIYIGNTGEYSVVEIMKAREKVIEKKKLQREALRNYKKNYQDGFLSRFYLLSWKMFIIPTFIITYIIIIAIFH